VREHGVAFSAAHRSAARLIAVADGPNAQPLTDLLATVTKEVVGREIRLSPDALDRALNPENFVAIRRTPGGPAADVVHAALEVSRKALVRDLEQVAQRRANLKAADEDRRAALDQL
jgi:argininosuccinate lyase